MPGLAQMTEKADLPSMTAILSQCFNSLDSIDGKLDQIYPFQAPGTPSTESQSDVSSSMMSALEVNLRRIIELSARLIAIEEHTQRIIGKLNDRL